VLGLVDNEVLDSKQLETLARRVPQQKAGRRKEGR